MISPMKSRYCSCHHAFVGHTLLALAASVLVLAAAGKARASTNLNLAYASVSSAQKLDLYVPTSTNGPLPLIIRIHGGAFKSGDKSDEASSLPALQARGYAVASLNYRLSSEAKFPAGAQDVKAAVRWLRANAATYGIDANRFAAWGGSAGSYFAVLLGVTGDQATLFDDFSLGNSNVSSAVQAVVDWFGPVDFGSMDSQQRAAPPAACPTSWQQHDPANSPESVWLGAALPTIPALVAQANLINYIASATKLPAFILSHGDNDCLVPHGQSEELHAALTAAGTISQLSIMPGYSHADSRFASTQTTPALDFLDLHLNPPPAMTPRLVADELQISWPASATGYRLEEASSLQTPGVWSAVTNAVVTTNGTSTVVLPTDSACRFIRLVK